MKVVRKLFVLSVTLTLLTLLAVSNLAGPQRLTSLMDTARGQGTLKVGQEEFIVKTVVVKLKEDGTGELVLVTDLQLFVTCGWSAPEDLSKGIDLTLTAGSTSAQGGGKLFLRSDGKTVARLSMEGSSNTKRKIQLNFVAD